MKNKEIIKKVAARVALDTSLRGLSVDELHDSLNQAIKFLDSSKSLKDKKDWLSDAVNIKMELRKRGVNVEVLKYKLPAMESLSKTSKKDKNIEDAEKLGESAFLKGLKRVPALDKNILDLIKKVTDTQIGVSIPYLKAWAKGWDKANLKKEVVSKLNKEKMTLEDSWQVLYKNFVDKTDLVKPEYKVDMKVNTEKQNLLRNIYDSAPVKQLYTYGLNNFGFNIEDLRVDVEHGNVEIKKLTK